MRLWVRVSMVAVVIVIGLATVVGVVLPQFNDRQVSGHLEIAALDAPVRVIRDDRSTPYIYANSLDDALRAQGFVAGQDRLFQLEAAKRAATGRLAEVFGAGDDDVILNLDREARVIGFHRHAVRQVEILSPTARRQLTTYLEGLNAYITTRQKTHPTEFKLAGFAPETWTEDDLLAITYYLGWASSANFDGELIAHHVLQAVGPEAFEEIAPLTVNPDDTASSTSRRASSQTRHRWAGKAAPPAEWTHGGWRQSGVGGSNNWAVSGAKAASPAAIVTNDPHLDSRMLPGPWHPVGIITPDVRIVGVSGGLPGVVIGRNEHVAFGVTNAYADAVDLYVETIDPTNPDHYLEGETSIPFRTLTEVISVKDDQAAGGIREEELTIRLTRRGPVITDTEPERGFGSVLSVRWASVEAMGSELGLDLLMYAEDIDQALAAIESVRIVSLNFVVGDTTGRIARRASGVAPIRLQGDGMTPFPVLDETDNWGGWISGRQMPGEVDPARGWTGSANHMTAPADYPYTYTTYASPAYRYRRIKEIMSAPQLSAEDVWAGQYDTENLFARDLAPILADALNSAEGEELQEFGRVLQEWNHQDNADLLAPTVFHEIVRQLAQATFEDELGPEATAAYLSNWYVWQQRF
ncbi:MAG: penicillin acylase family protein, partial [Pseudomonadota bacterium]